MAREPLCDCVEREVRRAPGGFLGEIYVWQCADCGACSAPIDPARLTPDVVGVAPWVDRELAERWQGRAA